ncbi:two-component system response regulator [Azospirillum sp. RWY-5-1]|uniref:Two-component system response regulator n=1 Tax=Azospirillum oleiclasticum TaxID=2735135 RepID=A0ABX2TJZ4_9PROT|nr:two-component system response regulator [Azospirillum oleiclasticum]NYZ16694.1 two-component system response regulator [Azospirillum oleiclasticum]NYZ23404.1 two-component system response regulator [Azospirillum oleiclasticum]
MNSGLEERSVVLVVDDTPENLTVMGALLREDYRVKVAPNGERALRIARSDGPPDLILLDVMMPDMDGYEVCRRLKADPQTRDIPVIFLTARTEERDEQEGLALGAVDYVTKPVSPPLLLARVRNHLSLKQAADIIRDRNAHLEAEVARRTRDLQASQDATIVAMASLAETRDAETGNHIRRTQRFVRILAEALRDDPVHGPAHRDLLTDAFIELLHKSAPLHDIGKVGVPDAILLKPGRLTPDEFAVMKTHTTLGYEAIRKAEGLLGDADSSFLRLAREIAHTHQEKWDGSGYPQGLRGEAIPISGRLMAIADVYDALISRRVYKDAMSHEQAVRIIREGRDTHFDPALVDTFLTIHHRFAEIAAELAD